MENEEKELNPFEQLSKRYQKFVLEYVKDFNATQAYLRWSPKSTYENAHRNSSRLRANEGINKAIDYICEQISKDEIVQLKTKILQEYKSVAYISIEDCKKQGLVKVNEKLKALDALANYTGIINNKVDVSITKDRSEIQKELDELVAKKRAEINSNE